MSQAAEYSYSYFIDRGYSPQAAAAIVGNFDHESGFNSRAVHDEGTGYGVAGWRDEKKGKGRKTNLLNFAKQNKLNPNSLGTQLQFADYELRTSEKRTGIALKRAKTVEEANIAMMHYERPQGYSKKQPQAGLGYDSRLARAKNALASYTGDAAIDGGPMRDDRQEPEFVDNTNTEAIPTNEMAWDEESLEAAAMEAEPEPTPGSRYKNAIKGLLDGMGSEQKSQQPFDYTPAGESDLETHYQYEEGAVPIDSYKSYGNYARGGNVQKFIDPRDWFAMFDEGEG